MQILFFSFKTINPEPSTYCWGKKSGQEINSHDYRNILLLVFLLMGTSTLMLIPFSMVDDIRWHIHVTIPFLTNLVLKILY